MRKISLFTYLFGSSALVLTVVLFILGMYNSSIFWDFFAQSTKEELGVQGELVKEIMTALPTDDRQSLEKIIKKVRSRNSSRITVIESDGRVFADSDEDPGTMSSHSDRPEILDAMKSGHGYSIRYSSTLKKDMIYVADSVRMPDGKERVVRISKPLKTLKETMSKTYSSLLIPFLILFSVAAGLLFFVTRYITRILRSMEDGAKTFESGHLSYRIPGSTFAETSRLASAMNKMAQNLSETINAEQTQKNKLSSVLENMDEGVIALDRSDCIVEMNRRARELFKITDDAVNSFNIRNFIRNPELIDLINSARTGSESVETECFMGTGRQTVLKIKVTPMKGLDGLIEGTLLVIRDNTNLNRLENVRKDFVSNVSHELKTPITSIKGYVETLRDGAVNDVETAKPFLDTIARQASRLDNIIDDLLVLSRIESKESGQTLQKETVQLKAFLDEAVSLCAQKASEKGSRVEVECSDDLTVLIHPRMLELAVVNLVDNAVKYSQPGALIKVSVDSTASSMVISVTDNGPGIPEEHLPRLFERFYRIDKGRSRAMGGTGLGLSIVKHIVQVHNGTVTVESTVGKGTKFIIHIPKNKILNT